MLAEPSPLIYLPFGPRDGDDTVGISMRSRLSDDAAVRATREALAQVAPDLAPETSGPRYE